MQLYICFPTRVQPLSYNGGLASYQAFSKEAILADISKKSADVSKNNDLNGKVIGVTEFSYVTLSSS